MEEVSIKGRSVVARKTRSMKMVIRVDNFFIVKILHVISYIKIKKKSLYNPLKYYWC